MVGSLLYREEVVKMNLGNLKRISYKIKRVLYTNDYISITLQINYAGRKFEDTVIIDMHDILEMAGYRTASYTSYTGEEMVIGDYYWPRWYKLSELPEPPRKH